MITGRNENPARSVSQSPTRSALRRSRSRLRPRLEAFEERVLLSVTFNEFSVSPDAASILNITAGPDGNLWFTVSGTNQVGEMHPDGSNVTLYGSSTGIAGFPAGSDPEGITSGGDGNIWFTQRAASQVSVLTTAANATATNPTGTITSFPTLGHPYEITKGPHQSGHDDTVWFTESSASGAWIGEIDVVTHAIHEFALPNANCDPTDIFVGVDGALWFTERAGNAIGRIDPNLPNQITEYPIPTTGSQPSGITLGSDDKLWFTESAGNKIGSLYSVAVTTTSSSVVPTNGAIYLPGVSTPSFGPGATIPAGTQLPVGTMIEYTGLTPGSVPYRITYGPDGNLWFSECGTQKLAEITTTGAITEFSEQLPGFPYGITSGPDGNVWFAEDLAVGRANLPGSDLSITTMNVPSSPVVVSSGSGDVSLDQLIDYQIPVFNNGPDPAQGVVLTVTLPAGAAFYVTGSGNDGTLSGNTVMFNIGNLAPGTAIFENVFATAAQPGTYTASANVTCTSPQKNLPVASASASVTVVQGADMAITSMQVSNPSPKVGDDFTYSITVVNNGPDVAKGATLTDVLPAGLQFLVNGSTGVYDDTTGTFTCGLGDLAPNSPFTATIHVQATQAGTITNAATASCTTPQNNTTNDSMSSTVNVGAPLKLGVSMQPSSPSVNDGDTLTYTIAVTNNGTATVDGVQVVDPLPAGLTFVSADPAWDGTSFGTRDIGGRVVSDLGSLDPGVTLNVKITLKATKPATITNTAYVFVNATDLTGASSDITQAAYAPSAAVQVVPVSDLAIAGFVAQDNAAGTNAGGHITYTFKITNNGPDTAHQVAFVDQFPQNVTYTSPSVDPSNGDVFVMYNPSGATGAYSIDGTGAAANLGDIPSGKWATVVLSVTTLDTSEVDNNASVGLAPANGVDPQLGNNSLAQALIANVPPVSIQSGYSNDGGGASPAAIGPVAPHDVPSSGTNPDTLTVNKAGTSTWTYTNTGSTTATGVDVTIPVPSGVVVANPQFDSSGAVGEIARINTTPTGQTVEFRLAYLLPGRTAIMTFSVTGTFVGTFVETATLTADQPLVGGGVLTGNDYVDVRSGLSGGLTYQHDNGPTAHPPVLSSVNIAPIYYGNQWDTTNNKIFMSLTNAFLGKIVNGPYMDFLSQYDTPYQTIGRGTVSGGEVMDSSTGLSALTDSQIQNIILQEVNAGRLTNPTDRLFFFYAPPGTIVTGSDGGNSAGTAPKPAVNFYGYHGAFTDAHGAEYYYVVMPYESSPNLNKPNMKTFDSMTDVASHELAEAVTDPGANITAQRAWDQTSDGQEIGDLANLKKLQLEPGTEGTYGDYGMLDGYAVQYEWANKYTYPNTNITIVNDAALPSEPAGAGGLSVSGIITPTNPATASPSVASRLSMLAPAATFSYSGPIATFSDPQHPNANPTDFTVSIDWGDGTSSQGVVTYDSASQQFVVSGTHTFAQAAGATADLTLSVVNNVTGDVAGLEDIVTLTQATAPAGTIQFDQATYDAYRNGSTAAIVVDRSGDTSVGATVHYAVSGGTAVNGTDFQAESGTLTFAPGQTSQVFTLPIYSNPSVTTDQTVDVVLSFVTGNATLGAQSTAVLTIHPSSTVFAPAAPLLDTSSDTGAMIVDRQTADNGSATAPLTFDAVNLGDPTGFVRVYDVTSPASPVLVGGPVQAVGGSASVVVNSQALADGVHQFALTEAGATTAAESPLSKSLAITIDTAAPISTVTALPATSGINIPVSWGGTDNTGGTGVSSYSVFVSDNGGAFQPWLTNTSLTTAMYAGAYGHTYAFYSVATDVAGNVQTTPANAQATTQTVATPLQVTSVSPNANFLTSLPNNQIVLTFNRTLAGLTADKADGSGFKSAPFAVMLLPSGPDGLTTQTRTGVFWSAPSGYDSGVLPIPATAVYHVNTNGTSTITLTPHQPLATDIYLVTVNGLHDGYGDPLVNAAGTAGSVYTSFDYHANPASQTPLSVTVVTTQNGTVVINGNQIPQPDTIGITFNKPLNTYTVNTGTIQLLAKNGGTYTPVASAVAYSPTTNTAYLTPEAALVPETTYVVAVSGSVSDDQAFPNPGMTLGQPSYRTFTVNSSVVTVSSPLTVVKTNPLNGTQWTSSLGYGAVTLSEGIDMSSLGRFSAMLISHTGGVTTGTSGYADVPVNAKLAFNPNTNQLIIVPTGLLQNHTIYLFSLSGIRAKNGDPLSGGAAFSTFLLNTPSTAHVLPATVPASGFATIPTAPVALPATAIPRVAVRHGSATAPHPARPAFHPRHATIAAPEPSGHWPLGPSAFFRRPVQHGIPLTRR